MDGGGVYLHNDLHESAEQLLIITFNQVQATPVLSAIVTWRYKCKSN